MKNKWIFSRYVDAGYSPIPALVAGKATFLEEWQKYSYENPTMAEADGWDKKYELGNKYAIALVCGPAGGHTVLDIDTDDPAIHAFCPKSFVNKVGRPGRIAHFFKYSDEHQFLSESKTGGLVGVHPRGKYHIIPPSLHPDTGSIYTWGGTDIVDVLKADLPELELNFLKLLPQNEKAKILNGGRNDAIKAIIVAMRSRGESEEKIIEQVFKFDLEHHAPSLFTDPGEQYRAKNDEEKKRAIMRMVASVTKSLLDNKIDIPVISLNSVIDAESEPVKFTYRALPPVPAGFLSSFVLAANKTSMADLSELALGGGISVLSSMLSGRFICEDTWPNEYVLALGSSGLGKSRIARLAKEVLKDTRLLGPDMYKSGQSFIQDLAKSPNRINVIDEATTFFDAMRSSGSYQSDLSDTLNKIYSSSNGLFSGVSSLNKGQAFGAARNPCVTLFCLTHQEGFRNSAQAYFSKSGLLPRFLIFETRDLVKINDGELTFADLEPEIQELRNFVNNFCEIFPIKKKSGLDKIYVDLGDVEVDSKNRNGLNHLNPELNFRIMPMEKQAKKYLKELRHQLFELNKAAPEHDRAFLNRILEHTVKMAMVCAISQARETVIEEDVIWGHQLVDALFHNSKLLRTDIKIANPGMGKMERVMTFLSGKGSASKREIQGVVNLWGKSLEQFMGDLKTEGLIRECRVETGGRPRTEYRLWSNDSMN